MVLFLEDGFVKSDMDVRPDHWRSLKISWNMLKLALNLIYWWSYVVFYILYFFMAVWLESLESCLMALVLKIVLTIVTSWWQWWRSFGNMLKMQAPTEWIQSRSWLFMSCLVFWGHTPSTHFRQKKPCKRVDQKTAKKPHAGILFGPLRQPIAIGKTHQPGTLPGCKSSGIQRRLPGYQLRIALAQTGAIVRHQGVTQLVFPDQSVHHSTSLGPFLRFLQAPEMLITQAINILPVCFLHPGSC